MTTARRVRECGKNWKLAAKLLALHEDTLRRWRRSEEAGTLLQPCLRGRPPVRSLREDRQALLDDLETNGCQQSIDSLQRRYRVLAKREVRHLVRRVRTVKRLRGRTRRSEVHLRPGAFWAVDHTFDHDVPVAMVRDLGSRRGLLAEPVECKSPKVLIAILEELFRREGAPLVLRMDGAFEDKAFLALLARCGVEPWITRPGSPWENGSMERSVGVGKRWVNGLCEAHGLLGEDRLAMYAVAMHLINTRTFPREFGGRTPEEMWDEREPLQPEERARFQERFNSEFEVIEKRLRRAEWPTKIELEATRRALAVVLVETGFLEVRSARVTPPISTQRARKITCV